MNIPQNARKCVLFWIFDVKEDKICQLFYKPTFRGKSWQMVISKLGTFGTQITPFWNKFLFIQFFSVIPLNILFSNFHQNMSLIVIKGHNSTFCKGGRTSKIDFLWFQRKSKWPPFNHCTVWHAYPLSVLFFREQNSQIFAKKLSESFKI